MRASWHIVQKIRFWAYWPWLFLYFRSGHRSRVLIHDGSKVLLVKGRWKLWFNDDSWSLPGGGIGAGEQPEDAAVRELNEELGLQVATRQLEPLGDGVVREHGLHYHAYFFKLQLPESTELRLQASEIADAKWLEAANISPDRLKPEVQSALQVWRR